MFDLKNIDVIKTDEEHGIRSYSFVGLKRKDNSSRLEFWLPIGFTDFDPSFENVKKFFFKMYRTFQVYRERKLNTLEREWRTTDRDGVFEFENGFSFINEADEQVVFYGKLNSLNKILEGYDELRISALEKKSLHSHEIDYSQIHRYMHRAYYLEDDIIYLDEMTIPKSILVQDSPSIVQLFCFIYTEIKIELEETDSVSNKAFELAEKFKDDFLEPSSSLFNEESFSSTIDTLRIIFEDISDKTTYKDEDFWHFYEAVEAFLFGEKSDDSNGIYFGINNFYDIWEDMCQSYMLSNDEYLQQIMFADAKGKLLTRKDLGIIPHMNINPFTVKINHATRPRYLRPDLVYLDTIDYSNEKLLDKIFTATPETFELNGKSFRKHQIVFKPNIIQNYPEIHTIYLEYLSQNESYLKNGKKPYYERILDKHYESFVADIINCAYRADAFSALEHGLVESVINVIDYKYMRLSDYIKYNPDSVNEFGENKIKDDIHKQLIYEWAIQNNIIGSNTKSEFWIPFYSENISIFKQIALFTNPHFATSQIDVVQINFNLLQEKYVKATA